MFPHRHRTWLLNANRVRAKPLSNELKFFFIASIVQQVDREKTHTLLVCPLRVSESLKGYCERGPYWLRKSMGAFIVEDFRLG